MCGKDNAHAICPQSTFEHSSSGMQPTRVLHVCTANAQGYTFTTTTTNNDNDNDNDNNNNNATTTTTTTNNNNNKHKTKHNNNTTLRDPTWMRCASMARCRNMIERP